MTPSRIGGMTAYRVRLLAGIVGVTLLLAAAWVFSLYQPLSDAVIEQQTEHLADVAASVALMLEATDAPLQATVVDLGADTGLRVTLITTDGTVLADSDEDPAAMADHGDRPEVVEALAGRRGEDIRRSDTQGLERLYVAVPSADGALVVRTSTSLTRIRALTAGIRDTGLWLLALALVAAVALAWRISRTTAGPIERLADTAHAMASGDLSTPVHGTTPALAPLSNALATLGDQMRDRIGEIERERESLRLVVDGLSDAVLLVEGGSVTLANRVAGTLLRGSPVQITGKPLDAIGLPASLESAIASHIDEAEPATVDLGPDPYQRYHRVRTVPLGGSSTGRRSLVVITDTTDRMRLDAIRSDFVANASHELKTPTAGILLLAESAASAAEDGDVANALGFVTAIQGEAARLKKLVSDLLDLSRMEKRPGPEAVADVRRSIDLAISAHHRSASGRGLELTADLSTIRGEDVAVAMDHTDLAIVLDNLLSNAITYTETGSVRVSVSTDGADVIITVSDTGMGIPEHDRERVFERFYRVDRARSRASGGTGLGLSLVKNAVERAGGSVSIDSHIGSGTSVTVRLKRVS
ncbi:HAMP domain-containing sensor histidine kinase [Anaerosoma tenue]|uniref:HAMP domain-containing sensor histidine kinase n=1 Tax=Anaerosoma tenue TaxID=2933588 RepID=UPI0022608F9E|nr:ATP-binding protein [Anaerosoma tenue]MCK8115573.1 ATP-binding protein [Anaerosoma tenue]